MSDKINHEELIEGYEHTIRRSKADSTVKEYTREVRNYLNWVDEMGFDLFDVSPSEIRSHLGDTLEEGYARGTLKTRRAAIRSLYDVAADIADNRTRPALDDVDPEAIPANPAHPDRMTMDFKEMRAGSKQAQHSSEDYIAAKKDHVELMLENIPASHAKGEDHQLLIRLMFYTGLRKSEVVKIRISDFDDSTTFRGDRSIKVRAEKTQSNRTVYYPPDLVPDLDRWVNGVGRDLLLGSRDSKYLFPSPDTPTSGPDQHISDQHVNYVIKKSAENAGIQEILYYDQAGNARAKFTSHSLRHGFAESCVEQGMDLRTLAELMGHTQADGTPNISTTVQYLRGVENQEIYRQHGPPQLK